MAERYDASAARYERWWAPVLRPTALGLLDEVERLLHDRRPLDRIVDLGAGTGTLTRGIVRRWPGARVTAVDASAGMLRTGEALADEELSADERVRIDYAVAAADRLPLAEASVDVVVSSFVLQLVPNRHRVLREVRRVLAPGGTLAWVTWLEGRSGERWRPDEAFDDAVADAEIDEDDPPADEPRSGDVTSVEAAAAQTRRAGFRDVRARERTLAYDWTAQSYLDFLELYDERDLFASLSAAERSRLRRAAERRLGRLRPADFQWRVPVVEVIARR